MKTTILLYSKWFISGRKTAIHPHQESQLKDFLVYSAKIGQGLAKKDVPMLVKSILDDDEKYRGLNITDDERAFKDNLPSIS